VTETASHPALYRRWRAQTFDRIVGQEAVVTTLRNAVRSGQVAHAMLFVGPRGTGKTSLARIVAKALNCTDLRDGEPCDRCEACVSIRDGRSLDVVEMDAASNNRVDDIRELLPRIYTAPSDLRRKVFIVDEVQRIKEGWDLLLKTLEEPPPHVAFIFCTTDSSQIRPAVLSRVQRFDFRRLTVDEIEGKLQTILAAEGREADDAAVGQIARLAAGGMRDAESMLDQLLAAGDGRLDAGRVRDLLGLAETETVDAFARALTDGDGATGLAILADLEDHGRDPRVFLDQVVDAIRAAISSSLRAGSRAERAELAALAAAAARLAGIDPSRSGPGGLRLQLELAVLAGVAAPGATTAATAPSAPASRPAASPRPAAASRPVAPDRSAAPESTEPASVGASAPADEAGPAPAPAPAAPPRAAPSTAKAVPAPAPAAEPVAAVAPARSTSAPPTSATSIPTSAASIPTDPSASPISGTDEGTLALLRDQWPEIVAYIAQHPPTKPLISACRPIAVDGRTVTLGFPEGRAFLMDVAERRRSNLEDGIGHFLGYPVAVRCVATNLDASADLGDAARIIDEARRIFADDIVDVGEVE
jgi:DNA polymerase-3 subunit gamma/tau